MRNESDSFLDEVWGIEAIIIFKNDIKKVIRQRDQAGTAVRQLQLRRTGGGLNSA